MAAWKGITSVRTEAVVDLEAVALGPSVEGLGRLRRPPVAAADVEVARRAGARRRRQEEEESRESHGDPSCHCHAHLS